MSVERVQQLKEQNRMLEQKIAQFVNHQSSNNLKGEILKFVEESKRNLNEMNRKIIEENSKQNQVLHGMTAHYELILKRQIELLTENKSMSQQKQAQDKVFNECIEKITQEYEGQIKEFETKVKANVKKIQDLSGGNIINRLLKNGRFKQAMQKRGCSLESLEKQSKLEEVSVQVEQKQKEIQEAEEKSSRLDEELSKMHELIDTMKSLLENMMKEKENILKQNAVLKEKLKQSETLIGKLLGNQISEQQGEEEEEEEEVGEQEQEEEEK